MNETVRATLSGLPKEFIDWLDEVTARIQMYKRMIKIKQIKSIANAETID